MRLLPLLLLLTLPLLAGARFVPPDEAKTLFRRDLLPIDTDTMRALSAQLTNLALRDHQDKPAQFRATAQLLAVASRLDPVNHRARDIRQRLTEGRSLKPAKPAVLRRAKSESWHIVDWLLHMEAGAEGQLLGNQLVDALRIIDPKHPSAARHQAKGEPERWNGVVASLDQFRSKSLPKPDPGKGPATKPTPEGPPSKPPMIRLRTASLKTPIFVSGKPSVSDPIITPLLLTIKENELATRFEFDFEPRIESSLSSKIRTRIRAPLLTAWKALPSGNTAVISTNKEHYDFRNDTALAGPAALLVHATLSGKTLRDDLLFIGEPRNDGSLVSPARAWDLLATVRHQALGGRLLVPPDLQGHLESLLVFEEPDFFVNFEVLIVSSLDAALTVGTNDGDPEGLAEATKGFQDLRSIAADKNIGQLAANAHVRTRLSSILEASPDHFSARMLLLQGSGRRPTTLALPTLQKELIRSLDPINRVLRTESDKLTTFLLEASAAQCRTRLDPLAEHLEIKHLPVHKTAVNLANSLRSLARRYKRDEEAKFPEPINLTQLRAEYSTFLKSIGGGHVIPPHSPPRIRKTIPNPKK